MSEFTKSENNFIGYEYRNFTVSRKMESVYADGYQNFGWILEDITSSAKSVFTVVMKYKRDRKIINKAELTRLQRQFEACVAEIETLERSKFVTASTVAYIVGVVGTAFMAGSTFAYLADMLSLCIILAIPGFAGWIIPYFCYSKIRSKKTANVTPLIDNKYDEIYEVCEKANGLLI
jgi:hypothetical protein